MPQGKYIIGIDLGTTNSACAYTKTDTTLLGSHAVTSSIEQLPIPQIIRSHTEGSPLSLPSFLYLPLQEELDAQVCSLSWAPSLSYCIGAYSLEKGADLPHRVVSSAKSWLSHEGIDRRKPLLPLALDSEEKMSVVEVMTSYLSHLQAAWNIQNPDHPFNKQTILVTVPASFDPSARQLVQECAQKAEYPDSLILLEEPLAAFYNWLHHHQETWRKQLQLGDVILIVDIGGGTTDFTLIQVEEENGELSLRRMAVGSHLLLGGDNLDLALTYFMKNKIEETGVSLDDWQFQKLLYACRNAKETLLGENPPSQVELTIPGRGKKLVGGSIQSSLSLEEVQQIIVDGFFPLLSPDQQANTERKSGLQEMGLPYAQDPRITSQLAKFLSMTGESDSQKVDQFVVPTAILFNGGTMKAPQLRKRVLEQLNQWAQYFDRPEIKELSESDYDYAVSRGAAYYGLVREGSGIRVKGGTTRSYYIGVAEPMPAVPGMKPPIKAVCIAPYGMEEGTEQVLESKTFYLLLGEHTQFRFFSHATPLLSNGIEPQMGTAISNWKGELTELHPIETILKREEEEKTTVAVKIKSKVTELGTLELWFESSEGENWKIEFNLRDNQA